MKVFYLLHPRLRFLSHLSWDGKETFWIPSPAVMAMTGLTILPWLMRVFRVVEVGGFASIFDEAAVDQATYACEDCRLPVPD